MFLLREGVLENPEDLAPVPGLSPPGTIGIYVGRVHAHVLAHVCVIGLQRDQKENTLEEVVVQGELERAHHGPPNRKLSSNHHQMHKDLSSLINRLLLHIPQINLLRDLRILQPVLVTEVLQFQQKQNYYKRKKTV